MKIKWKIQSETFYNGFDFRVELARFPLALLGGFVGFKLFLIAKNIGYVIAGISGLVFGFGYLGFLFTPYFIFWVCENWIREKDFDKP